MPKNDLPAAAEALLRERVHSFEELEVLAFLHRARPEAATAHRIAAALGIATAAATDALCELARRGLVAAEAGAEPRFRCPPLPPELDAAVASLARAYHDNRLAVVKLMSENAIRRMRTGALRAFSDAFVIGRKKNDG